jgi:hypothetical protein
VWLRIVGAGELSRSAQWFCSIYGIRWFHIFAGESPFEVNVVPCFLGEKSWFHDHPDIPAVITECCGQIGMRLSPFTAGRRSRCRRATRLGRHGREPRF